MLLHEIGHLLALPDKNGTPFLSDNGDRVAGEHNDQTVDTNCRRFIEGRVARTLSGRTNWVPHASGLRVGVLVL